jgi:D-lactate dehydrogenase
VLDISEALRDLVLPRLTLGAGRGIHGRPSRSAACARWVCRRRCSAVARACCTQVTMPEAIGCCGWAGDKGFTTPELNAHALRDLRTSLPAGCSSGVSTSRTCEIGLSDHAGVKYRSIVHLVDEASNHPR